MRTSLAWRNIVHEKTRSLIVLAGIGFATLLLFVQAGFYTSCRLSATRVHDMLAFDLCLTSPNYSIVGRAPNVPRRRLHQVIAYPATIAAAGVRIRVAPWRNPRDGDRQDVLTIAVDPDDRPFVDEQLNDGLAALATPRTALVDVVAHPRLGDAEPGDTVEVNRRDIQVIGSYAWGVGFTALGAIVTSDRTLATLYDESSPYPLSMVLVRLADGADPTAAAAELAAMLPPDVRVWTRDALVRHERAYWMRTKPMGLMFTSGLLIAMIVGIVILYQVLSADITKRLGEYATLKAIGYDPRQVRAVVVHQGLIYGLLGFVPSAAVASGLYAVLRQVTDLPIYMTPHKLVAVLLSSLAMCILSGSLAMRRVSTADPADLF